MGEGHVVEDDTIVESGAEVSELVEVPHKEWVVELCEGKLCFASVSGSV